MVGNLLIIMTVTISKTLDSPMYFCLANLSLIDIVYSAAISTKLILDLFFGRTIICFRVYMTQLFTEHLFCGSEVFLLLVMAYDHYVAICKPLHYLVVMRQWVCVALLAVFWDGGFLHSIIQLSTVYGLPFCGPNVIDHFVYDRYPLLKLVCTNTHVVDLLVVSNGGLICSMEFALLLLSYGAILHSLKNFNIDLYAPLMRIFHNGTFDLYSSPTAPGEPVLLWGLGQVVLLTCTTVCGILPGNGVGRILHVDPCC
ncbi:Putative olfactory receptor 4A4 [Heterocephalus glaber]|uniref:Putative olfactory receptor 4A4 n=1 Tax=Heterocephalus glaber TaxID=10181 RepID=G5C1U8_HETGA|nr:Putative olfactory receptor 4A4 [Heterocephalus glaber]